MLSIDKTPRADAIGALLHTKTLGRWLQVEAELPSTNTALKQQMHTLPHGATLIAATQTAGRGRQGRTFHSPDGGLYMSVLLHRDFASDTIGLLTSAVAVAAAKAIESLTDTRVHIKWVNDLWIYGKKVGGILTEGQPDTNGVVHSAVIGIGINVSPCTFPAELADIATSIGNETISPPTVSAVAAAILNQLEALLDAWDTDALIDALRDRSVVLGKELTVLRGNETFTAQALDIDRTGGLVVQTAEGLQTLQSGEVRVRL